MATHSELIKTLVHEIKADPSASESVKSSISRFETGVIDANVLRTDAWIYRMVVGMLGSIVIITVSGGILLAFKGDANNYKLPAELVAIGSAAVGALAGLLAPSPSTDRSR